MESILNELESKYLNFKLGEEQRNALLSIFTFINSNGFDEYSFMGAAGTGKTACTKLIISYLELHNIPYQLVCPTHKAKKILTNVTNRNVITIHQLLSLKPSIDILDLDMKDLKFTTKTENSIPYNGVIIIDECSMINDSLFDNIVESCKEKNCKLILQGDVSQIKPVKQHTIAKTFRCKNKSILTKIYRQSGKNCIRDILDVLRKKPLYKIESKYSEEGNIYSYSNAKDLIYSTIDLFKESIDTNNPNRIKIIAYTNKRVKAFNKSIKSQIFKENNAEYNIGDILFGYDNSECNGYNIENAGDYQVCNAFKSIETIGSVQMIG